MHSSIFLFLNIGGQEMIFIFIIALFFFGGKKLPEIARGLGKGIREFKDASENIKRDINDQINDFEKDIDRPSNKAIAESTTEASESSTESTNSDSAHADYVTNNEADISHSDQYYQQSYDYVAPNDYAHVSSDTEASASDESDKTDSKA